MENTSAMSDFPGPQKFRRRTAGVSLAITAFLVPYTLGWGWAWWKFAGASLAIILSLCWANPKDSVSKLGLRMGRIDIGLAVLSLFSVGLMAAYVIPHILRSFGYAADISYSHSWRYLATPFQVLNEEMVLRAVLLTILARLVDRKVVVSVSVATVFAAAHFLLCRFGPPRTALSINALTTLFLVGVALNQFFFTTGNIAIPFGIHLGWNFTRFGSHWVGQTSGLDLPVGMDFNLIEGNFIVIALAAILLVLAVGTNQIFGYAPHFRSAQMVKRQYR